MTYYCARSSEIAVGFTPSRNGMHVCINLVGAYLGPGTREGTMSFPLWFPTFKDQYLSNQICLASWRPPPSNDMLPVLWIIGASSNDWCMTCFSVVQYSPIVDYSSRSYSQQLEVCTSEPETGYCRKLFLVLYLYPYGNWND